MEHFGEHSLSVVLSQNPSQGNVTVSNLDSALFTLQVDNTSGSDTTDIVTRKKVVPPNPNPDRSTYISNRDNGEKIKTIYIDSKRAAWNFINFDGCEETRCKLITTPGPTDTSDCVVFHFTRAMDNINIPPKPSGQVWVFYAREAPYRTLKYWKWHNVVNWTFTPRRDSDFLMPYGRIVQHTKPLSMNFSSSAGRKSEGVLSIISNCNAQSMRNEYIELLRQYIKVDMHGKCGVNKKVSDQKRIQMLNETYKYFLSFENSNCRDYITEKAFDMYSYNIVPIMRGGASYNLYFPPGSYIDTNDFSQVRDLADYLKSLDSNPKAYLNYFTPRKYFGAKLFRKSRLSENDILCNLCKRLHNPGKYIRIYNSFQTWWSPSLPKHIPPSDYDQAIKNYTMYCRPPIDMK